MSRDRWTAAAVLLLIVAAGLVAVAATALIRDQPDPTPPGDAVCILLDAGQLDAAYDLWAMQFTGDAPARSVFFTAAQEGGWCP